MGIAKLYGQKASGININGIIKNYTATENISAGDLVEIVNETNVIKTTASQFDGVAKTSGVDGIVSIYTLYPNLLVNADFSKGLQDWSVTGTTDSAITTTVSDNTVYINVGETTTAGWMYLQQTFTLINGHKYYASVMGYYTLNSSNEGTTSMLEFREGNPFVQNLARGKTPNTWEKLSLVAENNSINACSFILGYFKQYHNVIFAYKNPKLYDLTAMYGAGNEPTKEWCDANL